MSEAAAFGVVAEKCDKALYISLKNSIWSPSDFSVARSSERASRWREQIMLATVKRRTLCRWLRVLASSNENFSHTVINMCHLSYGDCVVTSLRPKKKSSQTEASFIPWPFQCLSVLVAFRCPVPHAPRERERNPNGAQRENKAE